MLKHFVVTFHEENQNRSARSNKSNNYKCNSKSMIYFLSEHKERGLHTYRDQTTGKS